MILYTDIRITYTTCNVINNRWYTCSTTHRSTKNTTCKAGEAAKKQWSQQFKRGPRNTSREKGALEANQTLKLNPTVDLPFADWTVWNKCLNVYDLENKTWIWKRGQKQTQKLNSNPKKKIIQFRIYACTCAAWINTFFEDVTKSVWFGPPQIIFEKKYCNPFRKLMLRPVSFETRSKWNSKPFDGSGSDTKYHWRGKYDKRKKLKIQPKWHDWPQTIIESLLFLMSRGTKSQTEEGLKNFAKSKQ